MKVRAKTVSILLLSVFLFSSSSFACSVFITPVVVGSEFVVRVSGPKGPVAGIKVQLQGKSRISSVTDGRGEVRFSHVKNGKWNLYIDRAGVRNDAYLDVREGDPKARDVVHLSWPTSEIVSARKFAGTLSARFQNSTTSQVWDAAFPVDDLLSSADLVVFDYNGNSIWHGTTDEVGRFSVPIASSGLFFLKIRDPLKRTFFQLEGLIPVEITPESDRSSLELDLAMSSCGMSYLAGCATPMLNVTKSCGIVKDEEGATIGKAQLLIYSVGQMRKQEGLSLRDGSFDLSSLPPGEYRLVVGATGFSPIEIRLTLSDSGESGCQNPINVQLAIHGKCGTASVGSGSD